MDTPLLDFIRSYCESDTSRLHMPGHKGALFIGCEAMDITEIKGADVLLKADGIIKESQNNASRLFDSERTFYSTEGSSMCVRAMLYLARVCKNKNALPVVLAARNVHQSFIYGAAAVGLEPCWLTTDTETANYCSCPITATQLEDALSRFNAPISAVYVTSPDYLGAVQPIEELARVCHSYGTVLIVDNAHGAYLKFIEPSAHPLDLGADLCCDSAHKTLPVLTGGAYLHIGKNAPKAYCERATEALSMFSSTSPSYLTMASLDMCNAYLAEGFRERLKDTIIRVDKLKEKFRENGWNVLKSDPLRITIRTFDCGISGDEAAERLRKGSVECEFSDKDHLVLMATEQNTLRDFERISQSVCKAPSAEIKTEPVRMILNERVMSLRDALFSPNETVKTEDALGRICASPVVSCPPAVPVLVCGERLSSETIKLLKHFGVDFVKVIK